MHSETRSLALLIALLAPLATPAARAADPAPGVISLRDALTAALQNDAQLAAAAQQVRAGDGRAEQAGLLPNPSLSAAAENLGTSADDEGAEPPQATLRLAQLIELGGKRTKRQRLAALERDGSQWDYETRRATLAADTAKLFVAVLAMQERRALAADVVGVAADSRRNADTQLRAGATSPVDAARARLAAGEAQLALGERDRELAAARQALAAAWGAPQADFERADGNLSAIAPPPGNAAEVSANPDVARWATELAAREAALSLEQARAVPDVTVAVGPRYFIDAERVAAVVELDVPLPFFDRNQGAIAAASADLAVAGQQQRAAVQAARAAIGRASQDLSAAYARALVLRDDLIPAAEAGFTGARDAYRRGALRYLEVLDAQRTWFELRDQYVEALAAYHAARIDLDRLTGADVGAGGLP